MNTKPDPQDDLAKTRRQGPPALEAFQPIRIPPQAPKQEARPPRQPPPHPPKKSPPPAPKPQNKPKPPGRSCLWPVFGFVLLCIGLFLGYLFAPVRTNVLVLGVDAGLDRGALGRSDTIILATVSPLQPYVGMLSIPRDLWLTIPGVGENRINTAYFFAEAREPGSGARAAANVVAQNFNVPVDDTIVLQMDGLVGVIDAMGGVDVTLDKPTSGYAAGTYHFDGQEALAFTRSRAGSDDFARMSQGQTLLRAVMRRLLEPANWSRLPETWEALDAAVDVNIPLWQWPRLGLALLRAGPEGIDARTITRDMVTPFVTSQGAQVLAPKWEAINPLLEEMFR